MGKELPQLFQPRIDRFNADVAADESFIAAVEKRCVCLRVEFDELIERPKMFGSDNGCVLHLDRIERRRSIDNEIDFSTRPSSPVVELAAVPCVVTECL